MRRDAGYPGPFGAAIGPSGSWVPASSFIESTAGTISSGQAGFCIHDVAQTETIQAIGAQCTVAQSGGAATMTLGVYQDDGTGGQPLLTPSGLLGSAQVASGVIAVGLRSAALALTLKPGRYWLASFYRATTAPTTAPTWATFSRNWPNYWQPAGATNIASLSRGLYVQGLTALPTTAQTLLSNSGASAAVIALQTA